MPDTGFQFGVSQYTTQQWTFEQDIEAYAALGVDCVEVCEYKLDAGTAGRADGARRVRRD